MSPQFVDFDGDGDLDIVAGIFDGSPHVAYGDGTHWAQPVGILDEQGQRIVLNAFWNFETEKWDATDRCDPDGGAPAEGHLTSAIAFDWDADGDLDLLLGDHTGGYVYLRENRGTAAEPKFATRNRLVRAGDGPMLVAGTVATLRAVDWDGDGRLDLLVSGMGDAYGGGPGGGVFVHRNLGVEDGATRFAAAATLIPPSAKGTTGPTRPDAGLYADAADYDGDGDLDLVVGGYSMWEPPREPLDEAQKQRLADLEKQHAEVVERFLAYNRRMLDAQQGLEPAAQKALREEWLARDEYKRIVERLQAIEPAMKDLKPGVKRDSFVWLYENTSSKGPGAGGQR